MEGNFKNLEISKGAFYAIQQNGKCLLCGRPIEQYHHMIYGPNCGSNTVGFCTNCHREYKGLIGESVL